MHCEIHVFWINLISQNFYTLLDVKLSESKKYISYECNFLNGNKYLSNGIDDSNMHSYSLYLIRMFINIL